MLLKAKVPSVSGQDGHCSKNEVLWVYSDKPFWQAHASTGEYLCQGWAREHLLSLCWIALCQPDALGSHLLPLSLF